MLSQDHTNDALGLLKRITDDIEADVRSHETVYIEVIFCTQNTKGQIRRGSMACGDISVMQHRKIMLTIFSGLVGMEKEIDNADSAFQQMEAAHVQ